MDFDKLFEILPKDPIKWNIEDVKKWLKFIGLESFQEQFEEESIDGSCLATITEEDLTNDLKITSTIKKKKILYWIQVGIDGYSKYLDKKFEKDDLNHLKYAEVQKQNTNIFTQSKVIKNPVVTGNQQFDAQLHQQNMMQQNMQMNQYQQQFSNYEQQGQPDLLYDIKIQQTKSQKEFQNQQNQELQKGQIKQQEEIKENEVPKDSTATKQINELIIQPSEGPQTNFYCINELGGKIGRHSSNQILILEESISRYHAEITNEKGDFYLQDIGSTTGTFIKIIDQQVITLGMIIELGSNQFQVTQLVQNEENYGELNLLIIEGPNINVEYNLVFQERTQPYNVGRKPNNEIAMPDDHHLSNIHARIYYYDKKFIIEDQESTNGSWLRLSMEGQQSEKYPLHDKLIFKIGNTSTFMCKKNSLVLNINEKARNDQGCIICCEAERDALYMPCKHNTACVKCSKGLKECPVCRAKIDDFIKIYKV